MKPPRPSDPDRPAQDRRALPDRDARLKAALKANLARRKAQARARADEAAPATGDKRQG